MSGEVNTSLMSFSRSIEAFVQKTGVKADLVVQKVALDCFAGVIIRSPVDTGRFRASWRISVNQIDLSFEEEGQVESGALETKGQVQSARRTIKLARRLQTEVGTEIAGTIHFGDIVYISNNLPYAEPLENGWSDQAPQGMMKNTFQEVIASFDRDVATILGGGGY